MARPAPYIEGHPGDLFTASLWNEAQVRGREEILSHTHTGAGIEPTSELRVKSLTAETLTISGAATLPSGDNTPKVYAASMVYGSGDFISRYSTPSWYTTSNDFGGVVQCSGYTPYWSLLPPVLSFTLTRPSLVQVSARLGVSQTDSGSNGAWLGLVAGSGGSYAPLRMFPGNWPGNQGLGYSYSTLADPTASTWASWLSTHWSYYTNYNGRWPLFGLACKPYVGGAWYQFMPAFVQEAIELPAGTHEVRLAVSGSNVYIANLALRAIVFGGGR